jgi:hypothetical protein
MLDGLVGELSLLGRRLVSIFRHVLSLVMRDQGADMGVDRLRLLDQGLLLRWCRQCQGLLRLGELQLLLWRGQHRLLGLLKLLLLKLLLLLLCLGLLLLLLWLLLLLLLGRLNVNVECSASAL